MILLDESQLVGKQNVHIHGLTLQYVMLYGFNETEIFQWTSKLPV
jgi:hypothetical protein